MTRVVWEAMWDVLRVYEVCGNLLNIVKYRDARICVRIDEEMGKSFTIKGGVK